MKKIKIFLATFMSFAMVISALSGLYFKDAKTSKAASKTHLLKDEDTSIITNTVDNEHIVDSYYFFQNYRHIYPKVGGFIYDYDNKITLGFDSNKVINNLYKTDNWVWYDVTDGQATVIDIDKEVDGSRPKFEEGHNYTLKMDYYALDGYEFKYTDGKLDISMEFIDNAFGINNPPTMVATATEGFDPRKAISINVNFGTITNKISEIEIIATDFGKGDDINKIYMTWYNYDSMEAVDSSIISFVKNGEVIKRDYKAKEPEYLTPGNYSIMITMVANEGRVFEPDIKLKMHLAVPDEETGEMKLVEYEYFDTAYVNSDGSAALFKYDFEITCDHNCSEEWSTDFNSHWHECPDCHDKCDLEEHTFDEGETVDGVTTYTCSVCGYKKTLKNTDGKFMYAENSDGVELTSYVSPTEETDITIPETINDKPVTSIGEYCFASNKYKTSIESIKLPDSINTIGNGAFNGLSSLTSVNIPDGVERIEAETFFGCEALTSIDVPLSVTFIGESAFAYTSIEEIKLPCNVSIIKNNAFRECTKLKEIYIPDSVVELGNAAFLGCSGLTKVTMGSGITSLPQSLFDGCNSITDFTFPVLIQSMARYALPSTIKNVYFYGTEDEFETLIDSSNQSDYGYLLEDSVNKEYNYTSDVDYDYHNYEKGETVAPTCMEEGYTTYICSGCGKEKHEDIKPALGHDYVATIHAPTCTEVGYTIHTCKNCNHTYTDSLVEALGHKYKEIVTPATTTADGAIETKCEGCNDVKESKAIPMIGSFALGETTYIYDGKAKTPTVKPVDKNGTEIATDYYNITYSGNTNPGTGKVTITYKGNYSGTTSLDFTINPKGTSLKKLTAKKKKLTVKWKKNSVQTTGYQIQCSTASNFKKNKKTVTIKKNKTVKTVIKKLKKKKYFVRIRTYKTVDGKKYFSKWSKVKKIKVK